MLLPTFSWRTEQVLQAASLQVVLREDRPGRPAFIFHISFTIIHFFIFRGRTPGSNDHMAATIQWRMKMENDIWKIFEGCPVLFG